MNPMYVYQYLISQGMQPQQAWQMAMSTSGSLGTQGGLPPGGGASASPMTGGLDELLTALAGQKGVNMYQQPWNLQMQAANTGMNPTLLNERIQSLTRPMNQSLIKSVTRATNPGIAEAGLATSPGMSQQITAEALAPYQVQEQQMGQNAAFEGMQPAFQVGSGAAGEAPTAETSLLNMLRQLQGYYATP